MPCMHHTFGQIFTYDTYVKTMYGTYMKNEKKISCIHFTVPHRKAVHRIK